MPGANYPSQDIIDVVNDFCGIGAVEVIPPTNDTNGAAADHTGPPMEGTALLRQLQITLQEADDTTAKAKDLMQDWLQILPVNDRDNFVKYASSALQTRRCDYASLNKEGNSRLGILIQMSCYARFLKNQESDEAYVDRKEQIKDVQLKIMQVGRHLRKLLPLTNEDIKNYVVSGNASNGLMMGNSKPAIKRVAFCTVVGLMLITIRKITVVLETGSVNMA